MKYRVVTWRFKDNHLDEIEQERMYKRRLGPNSWISLYKENEATHLKSDIEFDNILDAEIHFIAICEQHKLPFWEAVFKSNQIKRRYSKSNWDTELYEIFVNTTYFAIKLLMKEVYEIASNDTEYNNKYTHLVLHNLQYISDNGIESITFKQWKSFRAYYNQNKSLIRSDIKEFLK